MLRQFELVEQIKSYDPSVDEDAVNRAYVYAVKMHGAQKRASGAPYFSHPIEVAGILTRFKLDACSIITALLHDTIEDTAATLADIENLFGSEVARLVDGVTKLTRIQLQSDQTKQAENFRKLVVAMSEDIRVLLVKLADRIHNMRTLHYVRNPNKRRRIALETMEIYAPLAERIGMHEIKNELEDLAFSELHVDARESLVTRLEFLRELDGSLVIRIIDQLRETLSHANINAVCSGREKTPYSIWRKMQRKEVGFEQLSDIIAFRMIVTNVEDCYRALGAIHGQYSMVPGRFKDYISTPKPNGYRSLHTGIIGPERHRIEVQIRTQEMHEIDELGVAAHWKYKQGAKNVNGRQYRWLRGLLEILEHTSGPEEFLEHTKLEMFQDQVFCFTPKGDLLNLPSGATPVDFAYAVHTAVGDACVGAKINGRMMPLHSILQNGDQIEIVTSKAQIPSLAWERFTVSGKAKASIRRFVRTQTQTQYMGLGRAILQRTFRQEGYEYTENGLERIVRKIKIQTTLNDLYSMIGQGLMSGRKVITRSCPGLTISRLRNIVFPTTRRNRQKLNTSVFVCNLISNPAVQYAGCCYPLPGDRIVGIATSSECVTVHTIDCKILEEYEDQSDRWLDLSWGKNLEGVAHIGRINLVVSNEPGTLGILSTVIARNQGNITNLKITNRSADFLDMLINVEVRDVQHLTNIMAALRVSAAISSVERAHR